MPDTKLAKSYLATAKRLAPKNAKRVSQANLRRSISSSYFAVFHALARTAADSLVGKRKASRSRHAWVEVYRGLAHGSCYDACKKAFNIDFPAEIHIFADNFIQLQDARKEADYDPLCRPTLSQAQTYIAIASMAIDALSGVSEKDKVAFATWVLITTPGAKHARELQNPQKGRMRNLAPGCAP